MIRQAVAAVALATTASLTGAAGAAPEEIVTRFVGLANAFHQSIGKDTAYGSSPDARFLTANCILDGIQQQAGDAGLDALMGMMQVLATGAEFDDPTIVGFNAAYGDEYRLTVSDCLTDVANG